MRRRTCCIGASALAAMPLSTALTRAFGATAEPSAAAGAQGRVAVASNVAATAVDEQQAALALLRRAGGGLVVVMRHALAPGTFDPPGFVAGECSTQRNLDDEGRAQARSIGAWYRTRQLVPTAVRSSAWCRCLDTAQLAFGRVQAWPPLDSMLRDSARRDAQAALLRTELARRARADVPGFEVWVTHQVNITALAGGFADSGDAVLLRHDAARDATVVLASLHIA